MEKVIYAERVNPDNSVKGTGPEWAESLEKTAQYLLRLDHQEQVAFFNELRALILTERDKRVACIRSEIEAASTRIDEILKGQEIIARIS